MTELQRIKSAWHGYVASARARRAARNDRQRLVQDLSLYTSPTDRADLDAVFARHEKSDTHEVWAAVSRQNSTLVHS